MRLHTLDVENYGLYSNEHFDFGTPAEGASGFCLIHGRNEAGKTTLLQLLRETLFGFPSRTPYDFGYNGDVAAKFRATLRDDTRIRVRRRKGNKDTFTGTIEPADGRGASAPLDEAMFDRMLGATAELYQNVFAFSLAELREGERSLKEAGVTEALFGGGAGGLSRFCRLRDRIQAEHRDLFKKTGKKPRINDLFGRLVEARRSLREKSVDPRDFDRIQAERVDAETEVERQRERCDEVRGRLRSLERVERGLPIWSRLVVLREDLAKLELPDGFPVDEVERFERLRERIDAIDADVTRLEAELDVGEDATGNRVDDETLVSLEPRIRSLGEDVGRVRRMLDDLPQRREEARTIMSRVERRTAELNPEWTTDDLDRFATSTSDRALIDDLAERDGTLRTREEAESRERRVLQRRLEQVRRRLEQLEPNPRLAGLERLLAGIDDFRRDRNRAAEVAREIEQLDREFEARRTSLGRHVGAEFASPSDVPVPLAATVDEFAERFRSRDEERSRAARRVEEVTAERERIAESLAALDVPGAPPTADDLRAAREERATTWNELREATVRSPASSETPGFWDAYERTVATADRIADERYAHADELVRREQLEREHERIERRLAEAGERVAAIDRTRTADESEWRALWAGCEFQPLAPAAMREWLNGFEAWRTADGRRGELAAEAERLAEATAGVDRQLTRGFPEAQAVPEALDAAVRERDEAREIDRQRRDLEAELPEIESSLRDVDEHCAKLAAERGAWDSQRREALRSLGLTEDWSVTVARKVLGEVMELLKDRAEAAQLERRVREMQAEVDEYDRRVKSVLAGLPVGAESFREGPLLETVGRLVAACDDVRRRRAARDAVEQTRSRTSDRLKGLIAERTKLTSESAALVEEAGVGGEKEFGRLVEVARERRELVGRVTESERELRTIFDGADLVACEAALDGADTDTIGGRIAETREELADRETDRTSAAETLGAIKDRLKSFDLDNDSAEVAATIEGYRAELAGAVDEWAPRVLVETLINQALDRFRRENQPEMLRDVAGLFERMTDGRYVGLQPKLDTEGTLQVQRTDGTLLEPAALSTGAREQLYLAIRLAYVRRYCGSAEPLPIVMDDVLVNFDEERSRRTLEVLAEVSERVQILFLTCHRHVVDIVREVVPGHHAIELTPTGPISRPAGTVEAPRRRSQPEVGEPAERANRRRAKPVESPEDAHPTLFPGS